MSFMAEIISSQHMINLKRRLKWGNSQNIIRSMIIGMAQIKIKLLRLKNKAWSVFLIYNILIISHQNNIAQQLFLDILFINKLMDAKGARDISMQPNFPCNYIFIKTPTIEDLRLRLIARKTETEESKKKRIANAEKELKMAEELGIYQKVFVNGEDREKFIQECENYILRDLYRE